MHPSKSFHSSRVVESLHVPSSRHRTDAQNFTPYQELKLCTTVLLVIAQFSSDDCVSLFGVFTFLRGKLAWSTFSPHPGTPRKTVKYVEKKTPTSGSCAITPPEAVDFEGFAPGNDMYVLRESALRLMGANQPVPISCFTTSAGYRPSR